MSGPPPGWVRNDLEAMYDRPKLEDFDHDDAWSRYGVEAEPAVLARVEEIAYELEDMLECRGSELHDVGAWRRAIRALMNKLRKDGTA